MRSRGGGRESEAVQDRIRARDELVATNIESTQGRVAEHVETRLQRSGVVGSSARRTSGRAHIRGAGMADSLTCGDGGGAEMEICSGPCVMLRLYIILVHVRHVQCVSVCLSFIMCILYPCHFNIVLGCPLCVRM